MARILNDYFNKMCVEIANSKPLKDLTLKGPSFFVYLKSGGGGGGGADLGRRATKNSEIWHVRRVHQYARADKIAMLKIKPFFNYANLC